MERIFAKPGGARLVPATKTARPCGAMPQVPAMLSDLWGRQAWERTEGRRCPGGICAPDRRRLRQGEGSGGRPLRTLRLRAGW